MQHAFSDAGYFKHLFGLGDQICDLLRQSLDGLGRISIRADAKRILTVNLEQVGSFIKNAGDGFVIHAEVKIKQISAGRPDGQLTKWTMARP